MPSSRHNERIVRFGQFEFRPDTKELNKSGIRIRVQAKPLQILRKLVDRPGELITREELRKELWPDGTFVDFESGLNTATNRLRVALQDSAEQPRYIETLPRLGYRFICPVQDIGAEVTVESVKEAEPSPMAASPDHTPKTFRRAVIYSLAAFAAVGAVTAFTVYSHSGLSAKSAQVTFHPLTYRPEVIYSARFLPDANSATYSTYSPSDGVRTLRLKVDGNNSQPVLVGHEKLVFDGRQTASLHKAGAEWVIEFPAGRTAYRYGGYISDLRVSPDGNSVAFIEHPMRDDDGGHIKMLDRNGNTHQLTADWSSASGLAWSHAGQEIWFTASKTGVVRNLYAVSTSGALRRLSNAPASLRLFDIAADGRVLVSVDDIRGAMLAQFPGSHEAADVSQFDEPNVQAMSKDGERVLFTESGDAGGQHYKTLLFDNAKHSSRVIGSGRAMALSPDGRFALLLDPQDNRNLMIVPLQGGSSRCISGGGLRYQWARFLSQDVIIAGASSSTSSLMIYRQSTNGGSPTPLTGYPYIDHPVIAPDHCRAVGRSETGLLVVNFCDNSTQPLRVAGSAVPAGWTADGKSVVVALFSSMPPLLVKVQIGNNSITKWASFSMPHDSSAAQIGSIAAAPDSGAFAYSTQEQLSRLYLVDGWS